MAYNVQSVQEWYTAGTTQYITGNCKYVYKECGCKLLESMSWKRLKVRVTYVQLKEITLPNPVSYNLFSFVIKSDHYYSYICYT